MGFLSACHLVKVLDSAPASAYVLVSAPAPVIVPVTAQLPARADFHAPRFLAAAGFGSDFLSVLALLYPVSVPSLLSVFVFEQQTRRARRIHLAILTLKQPSLKLNLSDQHQDQH